MLNIDDKDRQIADLEKQLAGFNKFMEINEWSSIQEMQDTLNACEQKYFEQQTNLAEKEKTIKEINKAYIETYKREREKDKKIEELKDLVNIWKNKLCEKMQTQLLSVTKEKEQQIRHQVCEEIREYIRSRESEVKGMGFILLLQKLDQIEGENDDN